MKESASLAVAGGIAAAVFAVVLGTRIYQDSLKQAAQSPATEDATLSAPPAPAAPASQPSTPHVAEPEPKSKEHVLSAAKKDPLADKMAKRERTAPTPRQERQTSDAAHDGLKQRNEEDEVLKSAKAPVAALGTSAEEATTSADQKLAANSAPATTPTAPAPLHPRASAPEAGTASSPAISARSLFYGGESARHNDRVMAQENERAMEPRIESGPQANRPERKAEGFVALGKAARADPQLKPLGLRYSFVVREENGQDREVDAMTASKSTEPVRFTVEANQDSYLQIWKTIGSSTPQLLLPDKTIGQISLKISAGQRQQIPLSADGGPITLTARLSRVPFGPVTRQEAAMFDRLSPNQLQETSTASLAAGSQEHATYVVSQDPSPTAQLSVAIPLNVH